MTTKDYMEIGVWDRFLRQGEFNLITPEQEACKAIFEQNILIEVVEDLSGTDTFKRMKEVSDNFKSAQKFMQNYTGEGEALLEYLDEVIKNPDVEPDLKHIKDSLVKILDVHNSQIANLEMFGLIRWKQVILNDMDNYVKIVPEKYEKVLDQETGVEIQEILDDLRWQSSKMQKVLINNIETFQRSYFDLQTPLLKIKNVSQSIAQAKNDLKPEFDKIWEYQDNENFDDDFVKDLENAFKDNFKLLESTVEELDIFTSKLTKKFRDKEYEITKDFAQNDNSSTMPLFPGSFAL